MKTTKKYLGKWIGVFVAALIALTAAPAIVNADPPTYVDVWTTRWTGGEDTVTANESWLEEDLDQFMEDIDDAITTGGANKTLVYEELFEVYKDYEFVPENKTTEDLSEFFEKVYEDNEEEIEDFLEEYGLEAEEYYDCHMHGRVFYSFNCVKVPLLFLHIYSPNGGWLQWYSYSSGEGGYEGCTQRTYTWTTWGWIGLWFPYLHNDWNILPHWFYMLTAQLEFEIPAD